jgi:hypothetical protein
MTLPGFIDELIEKDSIKNYNIITSEHKNVNYSISPSQLFPLCDWKCYDKCRMTICKMYGWSDHECSVHCIFSCCPEMAKYI